MKLKEEIIDRFPFLRAYPAGVVPVFTGRRMKRVAAECDSIVKDGFKRAAQMYGQKVKIKSLETTDTETVMKSLDYSSEPFAAFVETSELLNPKEGKGAKIASVILDDRDFPLMVIRDMESLEGGIARGGTVSLWEEMDREVQKEIYRVCVVAMYHDGKGEKLPDMTDAREALLKRVEEKGKDATQGDLLMGLAALERLAIVKYVKSHKTFDFGWISLDWALFGEDIDMLTYELEFGGDFHVLKVKPLSPAEGDALWRYFDIKGRLSKFNDKKSE